jgi:hypothetical protein
MQEFVLKKNSVLTQEYHQFVEDQLLVSINDTYLKRVAELKRLYAKSDNKTALFRKNHSSIYCFYWGQGRMETCLRMILNSTFKEQVRHLNDSSDFQKSDEMITRIWQRLETEQKGKENYPRPYLHLLETERHDWDQ